MSLITRVTNYQVAIYWAPSTANDFGLSTFDTPVEIDVRWEDKNEAYMTAAGTTAQSNAFVYVDQDVLLGGMLKLGELDSSTEDDPADEDDTYEIMRFDKLPNRRATEFLRTVFL